MVPKDGVEASKVPLRVITAANASEGALILHLPKGSLKLSDVRYIGRRGCCTVLETVARGILQFFGI